MFETNIKFMLTQVVITNIENGILYYIGYYYIIYHRQFISCFFILVIPVIIIYNIFTCVYV